MDPRIAGAGAAGQPGVGGRRRRRAGGLIALATALVVAAGLYGYRVRDYRPVFARTAGELVAVVDETDVGLAEGGGHLTEATLVADNGFRARVRVRAPLDAREERLPAALVMGGFRTGLRAVEVPPFTGDLLLASVEYPYHGPRGDLSAWQWIRHFPGMRRAALDTPAALLLAAQYLYSRPDVDPGRVSVIGASLGVPFTVAAVATDRRLAGAALLHGGGGIRRLFATAYADDGPPALVGFAALWIDWTLAPLEPVKYADGIAPRPVLMVNATGDEVVPEESVLALYRAARRPKRLIWIETPHVAASDPEVVERLMELTLEWMERHDLK